MNNQHGLLCMWLLSTTVSRFYFTLQHCPSPPHDHAPPPQPSTLPPPSSHSFMWRQLQIQIMRFSQLARLQRSLILSRCLGTAALTTALLKGRVQALSSSSSNPTTASCSCRRVFPPSGSTALASSSYASHSALVTIPTFLNGLVRILSWRQPLSCAAWAAASSSSTMQRAACEVVRSCRRS